MFVLLFHNHDFEHHFNPSDVFSRAHRCAIKIEIDEPVDTKFPWFFRGLSVSRANAVFQALIALPSNDKNKLKKTLGYDMDEEEIQKTSTPYDAMNFKTPSGEDLVVAYSIAKPTHPFRQLVVGPDKVNLYEKDIPHFGPILVFRENIVYFDDDRMPEHHLGEIESSVDEILGALEGLHFGA